MQCNIIIAKRNGMIVLKNHLNTNGTPSKSLTTNVTHHIETSQLICIANLLTGFYMMGNIGR